MFITRDYVCVSPERKYAARRSRERGRSLGGAVEEGRWEESVGVSCGKSLTAQVTCCYPVACGSGVPRWTHDEVSGSLPSQWQAGCCMQAENPSTPGSASTQRYSGPDHRRGAQARREHEIHRTKIIWTLTFMRSTVTTGVATMHATSNPPLHSSSPSLRPSPVPPIQV